MVRADKSRVEEMLFLWLSFFFLFFFLFFQMRFSLVGGGWVRRYLPSGDAVCYANILRTFFDGNFLFFFLFLTISFC